MKPAVRASIDFSASPSTDAEPTDTFPRAREGTDKEEKIGDNSDSLQSLTYQIKSTKDAEREARQLNKMLTDITSDGISDLFETDFGMTQVLIDVVSEVIAGKSWSGRGEKLVSIFFKYAMSLITRAIMSLK